MHLLSIETSTPRSSVALADQDVTLVSTSLGIGQRHGEFLGPAIRFCLDQAGLAATDVTGVAVGIGPGLYTGLRVGLATAKTFATALKLPVVGLSGLDVLAFQLRHSRRLICSALDARRNELFWAFYRCVPGGVQRLTESSVGSADRLAGEIQAAGEECIVVGDGGLRYRERLDEVDAEFAGVEYSHPDAADLATLAVPRFVREETQRPEELAPLYLRQVDAKIGWETRGRLHGGAATA